MERMKKSRYIYFFDDDKGYLGFSWLSNKYHLFPNQDKDIVSQLLENPNSVLTNNDARIYEHLIKKKFLILDSIDEFGHLYDYFLRTIRRDDILALTISPTLTCNLKCYYCYESHPPLKESRITEETLENILNYIKGRINKLKTLNISWFGGEPLIFCNMIVKFTKVLNELCNEYKIKFNSTITSNMVLLNPQRCQLLSEVGINSFHVTIDGSIENHNKVRIKRNGEGTYEILFNNLNTYLTTSQKNKVIIRVHFPANADHAYLDESLDTLNNIVPNLRNRIEVYPHILFSSCIDDWGSEKQKEISSTGTSQVNNILSEFRRQVYGMGFVSSQEKSFLSGRYCPADTNWYWSVNPDGYLSRCGLAFENERAQGKIENSKFIIEQNKDLTWKNKLLEGKITSGCRDCKYLPLCWGGCAYRNKENHKNNLDCCTYPNSWMMQRKLEDIKYYYFENNGTQDNETRQF
jgi:uncharacterized protein